MQRRVLTDFLSRSYLRGKGGNKLMVDFSDTLSTEFSGADKTLIGKIQYKEKVPTIGAVPLYQTETVSSMLAAFDGHEDVDITPIYSKYDDSKLVALKFTNANGVVVKIAVADASVIPAPGGLKVNPEYPVEIQLTSEFLKDFKRYYTAAKAGKTDNGLDVFAIIIKPGHNPTLVMNYNTNNTNEIRIPFDAKFPEETNISLCFDAGIVVEIFNANSDLTGTMKLSPLGLATIELCDEEISCTYHIVKTNVSETQKLDL